MGMAKMSLCIAIKESIGVCKENKWKPFYILMSNVHHDEATKEICDRYKKIKKHDLTFFRKDQLVKKAFGLNVVLDNSLNNKVKLLTKTGEGMDFTYYMYKQPKGG